MQELKPCPFCGGEAHVFVCDDEGNIRNAAYLERPYSGVGYSIAHSHEKNLNCPIARYAIDCALMGVWIYDTEEEAIEAWNRRVSEE